MKIKFLTTHCPRCIVLKKKLDAKQINYEEITDIKEIQSYDVDFVPAIVLENGYVLNFTDAVMWVNNCSGG